MSREKIFKELIIAIFLYCFSFIHIYGQSDGSLDLTFGQNGKVITTLGWIDVALSVAVQTDGKIIVAGLTQDDMGEMDFAILRYQENGMLDSSFGINGVVITDFGGQDWANSVKLQNDGKILVAGSTYQNYNTDFAICRYHTNGILDYSFGVNGKVTTDFWGFGDEANDMILQPDGKIVVVGTGGYSNFGIARYNTDGSLDTSFNNTGLVIIDFLNANANAWTTEIQSDGKIVVAGTSSPTPYNYFAITRITKNGQIDNSFGINGKVITDFGSQNNFAEAMKIQQDGKIILAGYSYCFPNYSQDFSIVRYNTDGSTDYTFGNNGFVRTDFGTSDYGYSVAIQNDNKIIVAGYSGYPDSSNFAIARYNTFGVLDSTFGNFGMVTTDFGGKWDNSYSMTIQPDGKIIAVGSTDFNGEDDIAIARYFCLPNNVNDMIRDDYSFLIYPNPSSGFFQINFPADAKNIIIYNMLGDVVYQENLLSQHSIKLNLYNNGIYIVSISTPTKTLNQKLIITR